jgi:hypothetical protein
MTKRLSIADSLSQDSDRLTPQLDLRIDSTLDAGACGHVEHRLTSAAVCLSGKATELHLNAAQISAAVVGVPNQRVDATPQTAAISNGKRRKRIFTRRESSSTIRLRDMIGN